MELLYLKTMEEYGLSYEELPEDAQLGIDQVNEVLKSQRMLEKVGKSLTSRALKKLKLYDKWVHLEILDFVYETDNNKVPAPNIEDVEDEIEDKLKGDEDEDMDDDNTQDDATTQKGLKIESELENMYANGNLSSTIEEIRRLAPTTYNHLFDTYAEGEENGIVTTRFSLIENDKKFELKQN